MSEGIVESKNYLCRHQFSRSLRTITNLPSNPLDPRSFPSKIHYGCKKRALVHFPALA